VTRSPGSEVRREDEGDEVDQLGSRPTSHATRRKDATYREKVRDGVLRVFWPRPAIVDEEEVDHWCEGEGRLTRQGCRTEVASQACPLLRPGLRARQRRAAGPGWPPRLN